MAKKAERILIVEDDAALARGLSHNLRYEGYEVLLAHDGLSGLELACNEKPELIVLDLRLPKMSGLDVLDALRREGFDMQIIILSARDREDDKVEGLRLGADDYVTKPFGLRELLARVEAALRRPRLRQAEVERKPLVVGPLSIDLRSRTVSRNGIDLNLTSKEFELLCFFVQRPRVVASRSQILNQVWGYDYEGTERTIDNFVRALRTKIEEDPTHPKLIETVFGVGYRWSAAEP
ncbi:MAG: response regulator transcription factor [Myxococcota bacterium]|jgi:DNA-binding response OmpR family regulator|nr:response regulator transcription factor [Myxococcota bacterium]